MEILGYGLRFAPRMDGPTVFWQTLAPAGSDLPRMLKIGFRDGETFRCGTVVPRMVSKEAALPSEVKLVSLGGESASMVLNNASDPSEIIDAREGDNGGAWWIRTALSRDRYRMGAAFLRRVHPARNPVVV
jgi:hypothetical protein